MSEVINSNDIRINNTKKVLFALRNSSPVTKKNISDSLNLSLPTIASITKILEEKEYIVSCGSVDSFVGRKPNLISIARNACYAVGVYVSTHNIDMAAVNFGGDILSQKTFSFYYAGNRDYWRSLSGEIDTFIDSLDIEKEMIKKIAIALPGSFDPKFWSDYSFTSYPEDALPLEDVPGLFSYPVEFVSTAIAAGVPRYWYKNFDRNCFVIYLSRFIEGCIMVKDPVSGVVHSTECPVGHLSLNFSGPECYCGNRGCFEDYCSTSRIVDHINGLDTRHEIIGRSPQKDIITWELFFEYMKDGNTEYAELWDKYLNMLSYAISSIHVLHNCDIVINGEISQYIARYKKKLVEKIASRSRNTSVDAISDYLHTGTFSAFDACIGAALYIFDSMVENL